MDCLIRCGHSSASISRNGDASKANLIWEMRTAQLFVWLVAPTVCDLFWKEDAMDCLIRCGHSASILKRGCDGLFN